MTNSNDDPGDAGEDFAALFAEYEKQQGGGRKGRRGPHPGETVRGRIVSIGTETVFVDLGGKSEGTLAIAEVRDDEGHLTVKAGDEIEARVVSTEEGQVVLRRVLGKGKEAHAELQQAFEMGIPVEGVVTAVNKGGLEVLVAGTRAFCPISQIDTRHVEDATVHVGQRYNFRITRYEGAGKGRENIVLSRRALLEEEARAKATETRAKLHAGAVVSGTVSSIKDYGAFIDLGGIEGMLHVSELGFQRVSHPRDVLVVGQPVEVQVLKIEKGDDPRHPDREKISLSLKSLEKDPWSDAKERFPEGARVPGKVMRLESFGAFVEIAPGVEGLVHVSEMGAAAPPGPGGVGGKGARQALKPGQSVEVTVLGVDTEKRRISLSLVGRESEDPDVPLSAGRAPARSFGTLGDLLKRSPPKNSPKPGQK